MSDSEGQAPEGQAPEERSRDPNDWSIELVPDWEEGGPRLRLKLPENPYVLDKRQLETMGLALIAGKIAIERLEAQTRLAEEQQKNRH